MFTFLCSLFFFFVALLGVTIFNYIMSFIAVVLFFVFYTKPEGCLINKFFISFNMLLCVVASAISVLPKVQVQKLLCSLRFFSGLDMFVCAVMAHEIGQI